MKRDFNKWFSKFKNTIVDYGYFVDFQKVYGNVESMKIELNILNSLIGSRDIEKDFDNLIKKYPAVLKCIPLLLAVRGSEIRIYDAGVERLYNFAENNVNKRDYKRFMRETGLFDLLENHIVRDLVDYATGVETGLDSNGRKKRIGDLMENLVERFLQEAGLVKDADYFKEMNASKIESRWELDMSAITNNGKVEKRFDFVVKTDDTVYGIETNFYATKGSKAIETARSYKQIAIESEEINGFEFVWFTDGGGWRSAQPNLEETFGVMEHIYNINDLEKGIAREIFK